MHVWVCTSMYVHTYALKSAREAACSRYLCTCRWVQVGKKNHIYILVISCLSMSLSLSTRGACRILSARKGCSDAVEVQPRPGNLTYMSKSLPPLLACLKPLKSCILHNAQAPWQPINTSTRILVGKDVGMGHQLETPL